MSVLIKGMEMPQNCGQCPCRQIFGDKMLCGITGDDIYKTHVCYMVEVPTPHGDLVDKQKLLKAWSELEDVSDKIKDPHDVEVALAEQTCEILFDAPTVIESEE